MNSPSAMDTPSLQFCDQEKSDIKLQINCFEGDDYQGNPVFLHSQVLKQSKYFEAKLSEPWSSETSPLRQINLTIASNGIAEYYMKCIRLMYSSYSGSSLSFCSVDEALHILPVALELLFEEGIQACITYLEAVPWTPQQKLKIRATLSSFQVNLSTELAARIEIPESSFRVELELLKDRLPEMLSEIYKTDSATCLLPRDLMRNSIKKYMVSNFQGNAPPAIQYICKEALLQEFRVRIDRICGGFDSEIEINAESSLWLLDLMKMYSREMFEAGFKMVVEDVKFAKRLLKHPRVLDRIKYYLLQILVERFLKSLANGDIIIPKSARISFLTTWVPVMAYLILHKSSTPFCSVSINHTYCNTFEEGVTRVVGSIPLEDQKQTFKHCMDVCDKFETLERKAFQWLINVIWMEVTSSNGSHLQIE